MHASSSGESAGQSAATVNRHHHVASFRSRPLLLAIRLAVAATVLSSAPYAMAEPAAQSQAKAYQIPAGYLGAALNRFALQSGVLISFDAASVKELKTPGLQGNYHVEDGFRELLRGSGYKARKNAEGYMLEAAPVADASKAEAEQSLPEVAVNSNADNDPNTEGTGSYTTKQMNTATKLAMSIRETPQSVSVITRQRMDDQILLSVNDVLQQTTGISVNQSAIDSSDSNTYYSRGFAIENYMIDGIPLSSGLGYLYAASDTAFYDRVEVVRGSTGLMSGVGTPSAAINLVRKKPTREFQASVTAMAGSWDNFRGEVDISGSLTEDGRIRGRIAAVKQDNNSYLDRLKQNKELFYGIVEVDLTPTLMFTAGVEYQQYDSDGMSRGAFPLFYQDGSKTNFNRSTSAASKWAYYDHEKTGYFASLEKRFDNAWIAKVLFNQQRSDYDAVIGYAGRGYPDRAGNGLGIWPGKWLSDPKQNSIDAFASGPFSLFGRQHEMVVGLTSSKTTYGGSTYTIWNIPGYNPSIPNFLTWDGATPAEPVFPVTGSFGYESRESGGYATVRLKPTDDLSIILGSRVSYWKEENSSTDLAGAKSSDERKETRVVTPYAGVVYDLSSHWSVYGSYTSIFKPQNNRSVSGSFLAPLEGNSYEAGVKSDFYDKRLNFSAAVFQIEQDNFAQALNQLTSTGEQAYKAVAGVKSRGFELELNGRLLPNWQVATGFSHSRAKDSEGERINSNVPTDLFKLYTTYRLPGDWSKLTVGGGANWQSKMYSDDVGPNGERFTQDAYTVVNLLARYQIDSHLTASLNVNNLFDKSYYGNTRSAFYGTPRSAMLTLKYQF